MRLSEYVQNRSPVYLGVPSDALIKAIEELERRAVLWDKISALPDDFLVGTYDEKWCINDANGVDHWGNTLEEALNQVTPIVCETPITRDNWRGRTKVDYAVLKCPQNCTSEDDYCDHAGLMR